MYLEKHFVSKGLKIKILEDALGHLPENWKSSTEQLRRGWIFCASSGVDSAASGGESRAETSGEILLGCRAGPASWLAAAVRSQREQGTCEVERLRGRTNILSP